MNAGSGGKQPQMIPQVSSAVLNRYCQSMHDGTRYDSNRV